MTRARILLDFTYFFYKIPWGLDGGIKGNKPVGSQLSSTCLNTKFK